MIAARPQTRTEALQPWRLLAPSSLGLLQRTCACGGDAPIAGECASCQSAKLLPARRPGATSPSAVPPILHQVPRAPGQPVDRATQDFMEPRFGYDFSKVGIHTDAPAAASARAVNALACTIGRDVVFGAGQYMPNTTTGRRVPRTAAAIAHSRPTDLAICRIGVTGSDTAGLLHHADGEPAALHTRGDPAVPRSGL